jgi:hypothetical protein
MGRSPMITSVATSVTDSTSALATSTTAPTTIPFAARTLPRLGIAARVVRIMPLPNSDVTATTPRTPVTSEPIHETRAGSEPIEACRRRSTDRPSQVATNEAAMPIDTRPATTRLPTTTALDLAVRSFHHSAATRSRMTAAPRPTGDQLEVGVLQ